MRSLAAFLSGVIAVVAIVVVLPALWVKERVVEPRGFEATAVKMGESPEVRAFMADTITNQVTTRAGAAAGALARPVAVRYTQSPAFTKDFVDLANQQHRWLFEPPTPGVDRQVMHVDLTTMVRRVAGEANPVLATLIRGPILVPVSQRDSALSAGRYEESGRQISQIAAGSAVVAVIGALGALVLSRRRFAMLAWLGLGAVVSAAAAWAGGYLFSARAKEEVAAVDSGVRQVAEATIDGLVANLHEWALIVGGIGAAVLIIGLVGRSLAGD